MNKEALLDSSYHKNIADHHQEEYKEAIGRPSTQPEAMQGLGFLERYDLFCKKIEPILHPHSYGWNITPPITIKGEVEGQGVVASLAFGAMEQSTTSGVIIGAIEPLVDYHSRQSIPRWTSFPGTRTSRRFVREFERDRPDRNDLPPLDNLEELLEVYFEAAKQLSPAELGTLGFPPNFFDQ
jgi:hypothetical protein